MANKSAAELKKEGAELKVLFAKVKKRQHNCAVLLSKDGVVVEAHIKKSPEILLKMAKKAGGMAKGAWGVMTIEGQVIVIDPINDKVPGSLTKIAKKFFSERGLKFRMEIKEPDDTQDAKHSKDAASGDDKETAAKLNALEKRLQKIKPMIEYAHKNPDTANCSLIIGEYKGAQDAMKGGNVKDAEERVMLLETAIKSLIEFLKSEKQDQANAQSDGGAADKQRKAMKRWLDGHRSEIKLVLKEKGTDNAKNLAKWLKAHAKNLKDGKLPDAQQALDEVALVLKKAEKEFKLSEKQRVAIMKDLEKIQQDMLREAANFGK